MASERFTTIKRIFSAAVDLPDDERARYLEEACAEDAELRDAVDALLRADGQTAMDVLRDPLFQPRETAAALSLIGPGPNPPDCIGKYRLIRKLGEGGMGAVYEAEQNHPCRRVALKTIRPQIATQSLARWFSREAQLLGKLQHPGIAQIFEAGTHVLPNGVAVPYIAMELVEGRTLDGYLRERNPPIRERLRLIASVCDAVCHAHQRGVIHRDLKPANILVNAAGEPKILDFGVARIISSDSAATLRTDTGQIVGTLGYMSPEQVSERPESIDARADVYALGVILYEAVAERPPYDVHGRALPDAIRIIREEEPTRLRFIDRRFRGDVETIVAKALEKDRRRRYATAAELADDIRRHLDDEPIHARPTSKFYQLKKFARRNRGLVIGLGVAAHVLLAGGIVSGVLAVRENQQRIRAEEKTTEASLQARRAEAREGDARRLAYRASIAAANASLQTGDSAAARASLAQAPADLRGWEWRHLRYAADRSLHRIKEAGRDPRVSISADGETLATAGDRPSVRIWDTTTGALKLELPVPAASKYMALRPDGGALLWSDGQSLARLIDTRTGEILWNRDGGLIVSPDAFHPDARVFAAGQADGLPAALFDAASGQLLRTLAEPRGLIALPSFAPDGKHVLLHYANGEFDIVDTTHFRTVWRDAAWNFALTPDGAFLTRVISESSRWELRHFALASGKAAQSLSLDTQMPAVWAFRPSLGDLAMADASGMIEIRDLTTHTLRARLPGHRGISLLYYSRDGRLLISAGPNGDVRVWDAALTAEPLLVSPPRYEMGYAAAVSRDGRRLARVGWGCVSVWDTQTGALCWRKFISRSFLHAVTFLADDTRLAVGGQRPGIVLLDAAAGETAAAFNVAGAELVFSLDASPDGRTLFAALDTGEIRTIDTRTGEQAMLGKHAGPAICCAVGPDGAVAASGSGNGLPGGDFGVLATPANDRTVRLWALAERKQLRQLEGHQEAVTCVAFDRAGGRVASGSLDQTVIVWDTRTGEPLFQMRDAGGPVRAVAFSPDGSRIVAGCDDTLRIWSGTTGELLASLPCGTGSGIHQIAFTADGETLTASGMGLALAVFETAPPACREAARERAVRGKMLVDELQNRFELTEDIVAALDADPNLPDDLRAAARRHALRAGDPATRFISDAYTVALNAHPSETERRLALRKIESAARAVPDNWRLLSTRGLLELRLGLTAQALDTLHRAEQNYVAHQMPLSTELALALALAEHQAGDRDQARRRMMELNAALRNAAPLSNERLAALLREANELMGLASGN